MTILDLVRKNDLEGIKALLDKSPETINARDKDGRTPLYRAAWHGNKGVCELLKARGGAI